MHSKSFQAQTLRLFCVPHSMVLQELHLGVAASPELELGTASACPDCHWDCHCIMLCRASVSKISAIWSPNRVQRALQYPNLKGEVRSCRNCQKPWFANCFPCLLQWPASTNSLRRADSMLWWCHTCRELIVMLDQPIVWRVFGPYLPRLDFDSLLRANWYPSWLRTLYRSGYLAAKRGWISHGR